MTAMEILLAGAGLVATATMGVSVFVLKDIFLKVGEVGALKERVRTLELQAIDTKRLPEAVIRLEEQVKYLVEKIDQLVKKLEANNV
jgi:hypothetical protein